MSKARISRLGSGTFEPAIGWENIEIPDAAAYSASQTTPYSADSSNPPHHYHPEDYSRSHRGEYYSPDVTPTSGGIPDSLRITSPVSPAFSRTEIHPPSAAATAESYGFQTQSHPRQATLDRNARPASLSAASGEYSIPSAPPPPPLPMEYDDTDYATVRLTEHNQISNEGRYLAPGGGRRNVGRRPSTLGRIGDKIIGTVKGRHSRSRSFLGRSIGGHGDPEMGKQTGAYAKVEEQDEDEPLGYDLSTFGAEFIPAPAARAMEEHKMDADYAYTGELRACCYRKV